MVYYDLVARCFEKRKYKESLFSLVCFRTDEFVNIVVAIKDDKLKYWGAIHSENIDD